MNKLKYESKKMMKIKEFSKETGLTSYTIRFYEKKNYLELKEMKK